MAEPFVASPVLSSPDLDSTGQSLAEEGRAGERREEEDRILNSRARRGSSGSYTNRLCVALTVLLFMGLIMGFILGMYSIRQQFTGVLECFTIVFTPIGGGITIVFTRAVKKSEHENTSKDGDGIKYALAMRELDNDIT